MGERKYQREDIWGNKYWEDDQGNRTYEREDVWGNKYYEDGDGKRINEREDVWGNRYREDEDGNREHYRDDIAGNKYREDVDGKKTYRREDIWGNKYEESEDNNGICLLVTACVEYAGLSEDCHELQVMRRFRDDYVHSFPAGEILIDVYCRLAPLILRRIQSDDKRNAVFEHLIVALGKAVSLLDDGSKSEAFILCEREFNTLRAKYEGNQRG
jgi:hypothetical protein